MPSIMIVDDSNVIRNRITRSSEKIKLDVVATAPNGRDAVILYDVLRPDLVTMDITMPIMDGLEASKEILAKDKNARIIMLSAMGDDELMAEAKKLGVKIFLKKPFDKEGMMLAVSKVMGVL